MTDIRCPMCGKPNPAGSEICQYCQARLKPLVIPQPPEEGGKTPAQGANENPEDSVPDWLRDLRSQNDAGQSGSEAEEEPLFSEEEASARISGTPGSEYDWLQGIVTPETGQEDAMQDDAEHHDAGHHDAGDQKPAWETTWENPSIPDVPAPPEAGENEKPDWLSSLGGENQNPDWLAGLPEESPAGPASENQPLEWLSGLPAESQPDSPNENQAGQPSPEESAYPPPEPAPEQPESAESEPDWLQRIRERQRLEQEEPPAAEEVPAEAEEPTPTLDEWLASLGKDQQQAGAGPVEPAEPAIPTPVEEPQLLETPELPGSLPETPAETPVEILHGAESPESKLPEEAEPPAEIPADLNNIPDWLSNVAPQETSVSKESGPAPEAETPPEDIAPAELPGWLNAMRPVESVTPSAPLETPADST
ncbi:MAG: zinc ribbon domain-containing protein, partial [Omnitrophica WOR_2 bacterium]